MKTKTERYILAVVVSVIFVCLNLYVWAMMTGEDTNDDDDQTLERSDYPVKSYASADETLGIGPTSAWIDHAGSGFTLTLPQRLRPVDQATLDGMLAGSQTSQHVLMLAMDEDSTTNGVNVTVSRIPTDSTMTPDIYVSGVADEMRGAKFTVDDVAAYSLGRQRFGRLIYSQESSVVGLITGVQFAFVENGNIWVINGAGISEYFDDWLPVFQVIAREFELD
jgi:hypothetical protein